MPSQLISDKYAPSYMGHAEMLLHITSDMINAPDEATFFAMALAHVGESLRVDRAYIFEFHGTKVSNTFEWTAEGIMPELDNLQDLEMKDMGSDFMPVHVSHGQIYATDHVKDIQDKDSREILLKQGIVSIIAVPLFFEGDVIGFFGFDRCFYEDNWVENTVSIVVAIGNMFSTAKQHFRMRRVLEIKQAQVQSLIDAFPFPVYISDMETHAVLFHNKSMADSIDLSRVQTEKCYKIFQGFDKPCSFCTNSRLTLGGEPYIWHHHNPLIGREYKIIDRCISWEHVKEARLSLALDITDSLRIQREQVLAHEANEARSRFLANMSHELRTPLNGIVGMTHLAAQTAIHPKTVAYLEKIGTSSRTLLTLINEMLDFSKIEADKVVLEKRPFSFFKVLEGIHSALQVEVERKKITLKTFIDPTLPSVLSGDALRITQILLNLTSNAIKFTDEGHVSISIYAQELSDDMHTNEKQCDVRSSSSIAVRMCVADTGIGIAEEQQAKIFDDFSQADTSTTRRYGGTGLGLAIAKRLSVLMGGDIFVYSEMNKGSSFTCQIILESTTETLPEENIEVLPNIANVRILLVEDNEINGLIATELLNQYGCHVHWVENGLLALESLEKEEYDLILMDIQMPVMDGLETVRRIRKVRRFDHLPIVAVSAHAMSEERQKSLDVGMQDHMVKPFMPDVLCKMVHQYVTKDFVYKK